MRQPAAFLEYKHRVVYSLLRAAVRVGFRLHLPLSQMVDLLEMAFFQEARETRASSWRRSRSSSVGPCARSPP
jgi:hypothetical protein